MTIELTFANIDLVRVAEDVRIVLEQWKKQQKKKSSFIVG